MSQNTEENRNPYAAYLNRGFSVKSVTKTEVGLNNDAVEYTTESLSKELNSVEMELVQNFFALTLVSNAVEDTIIIVDKNDKETPESLERRKSVLVRLQAALEDYKSLRCKVLNACPELETALSLALGEEYTSGKSKLIKVFGTVNSKHVVHNPLRYHYDFKKESTDPKKISSDTEETDFFKAHDDKKDEKGSGKDISKTPDDEEPKSIDESAVKTDKDMLDFISGMLDTPVFIKATLVEKRYLKDMIEEFKIKSSTRKVSPDIISSVDEYSRESLSTLSTLEKYSKLIKPKVQKTQKEKEDR